MLCPVCPDTRLVMSTRQEVEIDYCPACRGVWLDRGELDKIIERSQHEVAPAGRLQPVPAAQGRASDHDRGRDHHGSKHCERRHDSFLKRLFD